jgi:hypothetical protein
VAGLSLCPDALSDQAGTASCIGASSTPTLGSLYPLGLDLNVDLSGNVGVGTLAPQSRLHVAGGLTVDGGQAIGNNTGTASGGVIFDVSQRLTDFSGSTQWQMQFSNLEFDPAIDLTGADEKSLYGGLEVAHVPSTNSRNLHYLTGFYSAALTFGSGNIEFMAGTGSIATALGTSSIERQVGSFVASIADQSASIQDSRGLQVESGHWGVAGDVVANHGIYVQSPYAVQPLQNHYGIFLEDQDFGQNDSFAVYSEGGDVYFAGDVGIGTSAPAYKLQVGEAGDGTEARANGWNLLSSREYKRDIRPLDAAERAAVLAAIVDTDVVHYTYAGDPDAEEHIGVIAEDSPEEILSKDRGAVSLGDWSAFLMAGMQAQQTEIEELRCELDVLRAALARQERR